MAKTMGRILGNRRRATQAVDWRGRMSDNVAFALLVYTALQIFVTMGALKTGSGSILPYFGLVVLVAAIIPGCRIFEKRWENLPDGEAANPALASRFRRDVFVLWSCAIGLPLVLTGLFKAITHLF